MHGRPAAMAPGILINLEYLSIIKSAHGGPPMAPVHDGKGKEGAFEIGNHCYLGDEGQILLWPLATRPRRRIKAGAMMKALAKLIAHTSGRQRRSR